MNDKTNTSNPETLTEIARKMWLAGIGAYGKAFEDTRERLQGANTAGGEFFNELVSRGEQIENSTQERIGKAKQEATSGLEERIAKIRAALGRPAVNGHETDELARLKKENAALRRKLKRATTNQKDQAVDKAA